MPAACNGEAGPFSQAPPSNNFLLFVHCGTRERARAEAGAWAGWVECEISGAKRVYSWILQGGLCGFALISLLQS